METKKYQLVFCKWEDTTSSDSGWKSSDEAIDWADNTPGIVHQIGFKLEQNEEHLILVDSYFPDDDTVGTVVKIPMSMIRGEIKILEL